jgi:hypothetical protein
LFVDEKAFVRKGLSVRMRVLELGGFVEESACWQFLNVIIVGIAFFG